MSRKIFKTAMKYICERKEEKAISYLKGVFDTNKRIFNKILTELTEEEETILMYATFFGCFHLCEWLIRRRANPKYISTIGLSVATHITIKDIEKAKKFIQLYHNCGVNLTVEPEDYSWCIIRRVYEDNCIELINFVEELGYTKPAIIQ